jgi:hypothetical protein
MKSHDLKKRREPEKESSSEQSACAAGDSPMSGPSFESQKRTPGIFRVSFFVCVKEFTIAKDA